MPDSIDLHAYMKSNDKAAFNEFIKEHHSMGSQY